MKISLSRLGFKKRYIELGRPTANVLSGNKIWAQVVFFNWAVIDLKAKMASPRYEWDLSVIHLRFFMANVTWSNLLVPETMRAAKFRSPCSLRILQAKVFDLTDRIDGYKFLTQKGKTKILKLWMNLKALKTAFNHLKPFWWCLMYEISLDVWRQLMQIALRSICSHANVAQM